MTSQFSDMTSSSNFFYAVCFSCKIYLLVQFSCHYYHWFWSYGNFFYKGLTRNPEIGNIPVCVLPNIWRLEQVGDTKIGMNVSNKMLLNTAKF